MTDKEIIQKSEGKMLASGFLAMKHARERDYFWKNFAKVFNFDWRSYAEPTWQAFMKIMLPYIGNATGITNREFQPLSKQLPAELNYFTMLTMEIFKDEFKEEGLREGRIEGLKEFAKFLLINFPKYTDKKIAVTTTLPEPTIVQLRKELEEKKPNGKGHENKNKKADRNKNGHKNGKSKK